MKINKIRLIIATKHAQTIQMVVQYRMIYLSYQELIYYLQIDDVFIAVNENARQIYFFKLFIQNQEPTLLVGPRGSGKTRSLLRYLSQLPSDKYIINLINSSGHIKANRIQAKVMSKIDRLVHLTYYIIS